MKKFTLLLLAAGLFSLGCTTTKQVKPDAQKKTVAARNAGETPAPIAKLLPPDKLNDQNAREQAMLLDQKLQQESQNNGQLAAGKSSGP